MRQRLLFASFFSLLFSIIAVASDEIKGSEVDVRPYVQQGAAELALSILSSHAPNDESNSITRWHWHQQRLDIARHNQQWPLVLELVQGLLEQDDLEAEQLVVLYRGRAEAYFKQSQYDLARDSLLVALWMPGLPVALLPDIRQDLIRAYIGEGRFADARSAVLRFELDYPDQLNLPGWLTIAAKLLLAEKEPQQALNLLARSNDSESHLLSFIAKARVAAEDQTLPALNDLALWLADSNVDVEVRQQFFSTLFESRLLLSAPVPERVELLEYLFDQDLVRDADSQSLGNALWAAYSDYGQWVANQNQLLMGSYEPWLTLAQELSAVESLQSRALLAWLVLNTDTELSRRAHEALGENISKDEGAFQILEALYLSAGKFEGGLSAPESVRYRLLDQALNVGRQTLAVGLMNGLPRPADASSLVDWQLRRARVQVLGGTPEYGAKLLENLTKSGLHFSGLQLEAYLAVYYELQGLGQSMLGYVVLDALLPQLESVDLRRQVLAWMADIRFGQQDYEVSAQLYLKASVLAGGTSAWGVQVRHRAAMALARAGFSRDAGQLYRDLIDNEFDAQVRQSLKHELKQLSFIKKPAP